MSNELPNSTLPFSPLLSNDDLSLINEIELSLQLQSDESCLIEGTLQTQIPATPNHQTSNVTQPMSNIPLISTLPFSTLLLPEDLSLINEIELIINQSVCTQLMSNPITNQLNSQLNHPPPPSPVMTLH